ncbi:MAG: hypothetical protein KJO69_04815 [Gammaproteobacteria bacterium]|nr:hypothetical protein [Gammaproteobacteria bacterium]
MFDDAASIEVPKGSKTSYDRRRLVASGEAGSLRIKRFEGRPIIMWEVHLYYPDAEQEYQTAEWIKGFKGKGVERLVPRQGEVVRFDLPRELRNYPGGEQSMFRYDIRSLDGRKTMRALVYCLDEFCGSEARRIALHQQISAMLKSLQFTNTP